jgi:cytochrome c oxidase assembly factor CtaG/cytochrome c2
MPVNSNLLLALAHPGDGHLGGGAGWHVWTFEPGVVIPLVATAVAYALGVRRLWRTAGVGQGISRGQALAFAVGWMAIAAALISPVDAISAELFSVHMIQHELLMLIAAPLLVLAVPILAFLWTLPAGARKTTMRAVRHPVLIAAWHAITAPAAVWLLHSVALWMWHVPSLYQAAIESEGVHAVEHASFFVTAALFWWGLTRGRYGRLGYGSAVIYVFATALHSGLLGAALTLSPGAWYPVHQATVDGWSLTPLEDQQLAGLIMWIPAGVIFTAIGLFFFAAWLNESGRRARYNADPPHRAAGMRLRADAGRPRKRFGFPLLLLFSSLVIGSGCRRSEVFRSAAAMTGGDPERGRVAVSTYGCDTCHTIPGVRTAQGRVGPGLAGVARRVYIAGQVPNTPPNLQDWIRHPHRHDSQTVMPETGVTEQDARDIAAFLYTLQ